MHPINTDEADVADSDSDSNSNDNSLSSTGTAGDIKNDTTQSDLALWQHPQNTKICKLALGYYLNFRKTGWDTMVTTIQTPLLHTGIRDVYQTRASISTSLSKTISTKS